MRSFISRQNIQIIIWFSKMRANTTNIKNEVRRYNRPTNVLFNGIPCTLSMEISISRLTKIKFRDKYTLKKIKINYIFFSSDTTCSFTVYRVNTNVCQVRPLYVDCRRHQFRIWKISIWNLFHWFYYYILTFWVHRMTKSVHKQKKV